MFEDTEPTISHFYARGAATTRAIKENHLYDSANLYNKTYSFCGDKQWMLSEFNGINTIPDWLSISVDLDAQ